MGQILSLGQNFLKLSISYYFTFLKKQKNKTTNTHDLFQLNVWKNIFSGLV